MNMTVKLSPKQIRKINKSFPGHVNFKLNPDAMLVLILPDGVDEQRVAILDGAYGTYCGSISVKEAFAL